MIFLSSPQHKINASLKLSGSKSISNRLLILREVLNANFELKNLSDSEDTVLLQNALQQVKNKTQATINIHHAGTDMRFLTALLAVTNGEWQLTGSERMKQRPIGELVNALRTLGADIQYLEKENFPPLKITGKTLQGGKVEINGNISSQYISALLLVAPLFKNGLKISLKSDLVSRPYIDMTISLLKQFGVNVNASENVIEVFPTKINSQKTSFVVESDWSSASYWYSICAVSQNAEIELSFLHKHSLQADSVLPALYEQFGVTTVFKENSVLLSCNKKSDLKGFNFDFTDCPDIAQTLAVTCFTLNIPATLTGLQTLKVKETDRIFALKTELEKLGAKVIATENSLQLQPTTKFPAEAIIETYNDHRMAMSFAPLAFVIPKLNIKNPEVVSKSYPAFWEDLKTVGFSVLSC
ncbi:MAG: 3-phosphoshikimate 1-carboxyvinyltransferase [Bacteroidetes bacterium]|nr:3-phosphoshikimate 1-carboxyvinyltransferase [Bacteroidota bacterium]